MALAAAAGVWAAVTAIAGGFIIGVGPFRVSSRDGLRPLLAAVLLLVAARFLLGGVEFRRGLARARDC